MPPELEHSGTIQVLNTNATPVSVELSRGQKGGYGWTLKAYDADFDLAMAKIKEADAKLRQEYLEAQPEEA